MIKRLKYLLLTFGLFVGSLINAQTYPVQLSTILNPPNSVYLEDYSAPSGNLWMMNLTLLDLNEPSRDVYLRLSIESNGATLQSKPDYIPVQDIITLYPGIPQQITGTDLAPYINATAMNASGITWSQIQQNGRLPEGFYSFCVEVVDYLSGEILSQKSCQSSWIKLNDEPLINNPMCDAVIDPSLPTNIAFQWQSTNLLSPNSANSTEYQLTLFEVTDPNVSPLNAVNNGDVIQIFQTPWQTSSFYFYSLADPVLEKGKGYAYTVQARDISGRDLFKNNGFSQICWFWYGYPEGGFIELIEPADSAGFTKYAPQYFNWEAPQNLLSNQGVSYRIQIVEVDESAGQTASDALEFNPVWYEETFPVSFTGNGRDFELSKAVKAFDKGQRYAWKVTGHTGNQVIAASQEYTFVGPPLVDEFYVNNKRVVVSSLSTNDIHDLSGEGLVSLDENDSVMVDVHFEHIDLTSIAGIMYMVSGEVEGEFDEYQIEINPTLYENGTATAYLDQLSLTVNGDLKLFGNIEWNLPLIANSYEIPSVWSKDTWFDYFNYRLTGTPELVSGQQYELLEPFGFQLELEESSDFLVINNQFELRFNGVVTLPDHVKGVNEDLRVQLFFENHNQLYYINGNTQHLLSKIVPVGEANIRMVPLHYTVDFSDNLSPGKFEDVASWKGVYLDEFQLLFAPVFYGNSSTLQFTSSIDKTITLADRDSAKAWVTPSGLDLRLNETFTENEGITFNTFPGSLDRIEIEVISGAVSNSRLLGNIKIPVLSETEQFTFTVPLTEDGYNQGYLDESLDERTFVFNQGNGDQKMSLKINRAVFADDSKIMMNIDVSWPTFQIELNNLDGFMVWGNYDIGFVTPNGYNALINQVNGVASDYDITIDYVGAGRDANLYSIGVSGTMMMGEDVSGDGGAPVFSAYSIFESSIIPENYQPYSNNDPEYSLPEYTAPGQGEGSGPALGEGDDSGLVDHALDMFSNYLGSMSGALSGDSTGAEVDLDDLFSEEMEGDTAFLGEDITLEKIITYIDIITPFLEEEKQPKAIELKQRLEEFNNSELMEIYRELKENGFNLNKILKARIDNLASQLNNKITAEMDTVNMKIENAILNPVDTLMSKVTGFIEETLTELTDNVISAIGINDGAVLDVIIDARETALSNVTSALENSVHASIKTNVTDPITIRIDTIFTNEITNFVEQQITSLGYAILDKNFDQISLSGIVDDAGTVIKGMAGDIVQTFKSISLQGVKNTCENIVQDAYEGINWSQIGENIKNEILNNLEGEVANMVTDALVGLFNEDSFGGDFIEGMMDNVEFDFSNLGEKIENGEIGDIVSFDPTHIKIQSKVADIEGMLKFKKDDPIWGDSWQAMLNAQVKQPKEFGIAAQYLNGKVDGYNYWFLELTAPYGLNVPIFSGINLDGIGGKVFHHMTYNMDDKTYLPNEETRYGVGVDMYMIDAASGGQSTRMNVTAEVTVLEDYFTMQIRGDVGMAFPDDEFSTPFTDAVANGNGFLAFSSLDNTLLGQFNAQTNLAPLICANGEMGLLVSPDYWNFYVGTETNPLTARVLCLDAFSLKSWFDIDNQGLSLGLQMDATLWARSPWIKIGRYWRPYAGFEFHFLSRMDVQFQPEFVLQEALIYLYINSEIGIDWEKRNGDGDVTDSGNIVLLGVYLEGEAHYVNRPSEAYIYGHLAGEVTVLTINVGFDLEINRDLSVPQ